MEVHPRGGVPTAAPTKLHLGLKMTQATVLIVCSSYSFTRYFICEFVGFPLVSSGKKLLELKDEIREASCDMIVPWHVEPC